MKNRGKGVLIVLVISILLFILVCLLLFNINELRNSLEVIEIQQEKIKDEEVLEEDGLIIIKLTKNNWDDYFTVETKEDLVLNEAGELEKVQFACYLSLKKEYHDKISPTQKESYLNLTGLQPIEMMQYEITDAVAGEWRLTKKQSEGLVVGGRDRMLLWWNSNDTKDKNFVSTITFECGEYLGNLVTEVPGEPEVQAADGVLVLKND